MSTKNRTSFSEAMERALVRLEKMARGGALGGAMVLAIGSAPLVGCAGPADAGAPVAIDGQNADWAQYEGVRDPGMITYLDSFWTQYSDCGGRGGCLGADIFVKLKVKRVDGADLNSKRVGVVYHAPGRAEQTALATYFSDIGDGYEEWHARVSMRTYDAAGALLINPWYQDGLGHTYYDDNHGENYAVPYGSTYQIIGLYSRLEDVQITPDGIKGFVAAFVANLDFDKQVQMVYTTDGWKTVQTADLHYVQSFGTTHEQWQYDFDLPGQYSELQFALVYRHGVVNGAKTYEWWDNNAFRNYDVKAQ